ncbi:MAG: response regulator [Alphaproteobacteria bacterium]
MADIQDKILVNLPYLRRYARMLTGSQERGDEYVRACLEAIVTEPESIERATDVRIELFRQFHAIWSVVDSVAPEDATIDLDSRVKRSLASLPSRERQALLLVSVEGFLPGEAGRILGADAGEVDALLRKARADLSQRTTANILIIEDDAIIALNNAEIVREMGHNVTGTAARQSEALALVEQTAPDLILADIQLADGDDGIKTVQEILKTARMPVIFVTGFPERLLTGRTLEPAFVITKPFEPDTLKTAIAHALSTAD